MAADEAVGAGDQDRDSPARDTLEHLPCAAQLLALADVEPVVVDLERPDGSSRSMTLASTSSIDTCSPRATRPTTHGSSTYMPALTSRDSVGFSSIATTRSPTRTMQPNGTVCR